MLKYLNAVYQIKPSAYGFIKNRNNALNAQNHCKQENVLKIDLKDFFEQIHFGRVRGLFINKPYEIGEEAAMVLAQLVCYKGKLPQGAPTSPILTNMICSPLDTQLIILAKKYRMVYTRYADDISFSTHLKKFPEEIVYIQDGEICLGKELAKILEHQSFKVNTNKIYLRRKSQCQEVTGLVVNKFVNVKRKYIRDIRVILYKCKKQGIYETAKQYIDKGYCANAGIMMFSNNADNKQIIIDWFEKVIKGKIQYLGQIRGKENGYYLKYASEMNNIFEKEIFTLDKELKFRDMLDKYCYIVNSQDKSVIVQGSAFMLKNYGILTNYHVVKYNVFYRIETEKGKLIVFIDGKDTLKKQNETIDYVMYNNVCAEEEGWELSDKEIDIETELILAGFPQHTKDDSINVTHCRVSGSKKFNGQKIWTVDSPIYHGASGGVVLDVNYKVIGIIRCGADTIENEDEIIPGINPITDVIKDLEMVNDE